MIKSLLKVLVNFVLFVALQVLVLNNIHLFKIVTPFLYLYIIVKIPINLTRVQVIWISFLTGLTIDIFSNTMGMHAAACTLAGMFRNPLMDSFVDREMIEGSTPSYHTLGTGAFMRYAFSLVLLHHVALYLIESVSFFDPLYLILRIVCSVVLTTLCIFIVEAFNLSGKGGES